MEGRAKGEEASVRLKVSKAMRSGQTPNLTVGGLLGNHPLPLPLLMPEAILRQINNT